MTVPRTMVLAMSRTALYALGLTMGLALLAIACGSKPKYPSCDGDKDCQNAEVCVNKRCVQCADDKACGDGKQCVDGACEPVPGWCSADGDCPNGGVCKDHKCTPCASDNECGDGGKCQNGKCLRKGQCAVDEDCPEDEDCVKGVCTKAGAADGAMPTCTLATIYFDFDAAQIREDAKATLQKNSECLSTTPRGVAVAAHTDPRGTDEYNIALSDQRGRSVADYLIRLGIDASRLRVVPKGETEAQGLDEAAWARDRKVEFSWQ